MKCVEKLLWVFKTGGLKTNKQLGLTSVTQLSDAHFQGTLYHKRKESVWITYILY